METVYIFLIFVFSTAFGIPIVQWFNNQYLRKFVDSAKEAAVAARARTTERMGSGAGRLSNNRLSGKFKT